MIWRASLLIFILAVSGSISHSRAIAQNISALKPGVVRIKNDKQDEIGTGFIVKIDGTNVHIVTAAHVVRGEEHPKVYLFSQQFESLTATVLDREEDDNKGLALLLLKTNALTASKLIALKVANTSGLGNGEDVKIIGFPGGISFWTVDIGNVKRLEGRNLVLSGAIRGGNSGGPVILNQCAIGLVTDIIKTDTSQSDAYAAGAEGIVQYVNGIVPGLIMIGCKPVVEPQTITLNISLYKIEAYEHGGGADTRWDFEVFADTMSMPLGQKTFKKGEFPISKSFDIDVDPNKSFTIKVVGDRHKKGVQANGEISLRWNPSRTEALSREISVKVPKDIAQGNFRFYFTIKRKITGTS